MYAVVTLALKDLRLISRDYAGLFWMFGFPLMFALFFGAIFSGMGGGGGSPIRVAVVDEDQSDGSKAFVERLKKSPALKLQDAADAPEARGKVLAGKLVAYVVLKKGFGDSIGFMGGGTDTHVEVGMDPARKAEREMLRGVLLETSFAGMQDMLDKPAQAKAQMDRMRKQVREAKDIPEDRKKTVLKFYDDLEGFFVNLKSDPKDAKENAAAAQFQGMRMDIKEVTPEGHGPRSAFEITFPSSILWGIIGCVTTFAISLVTERVQGTLQRLRVAPVSRAQVLAGKGLACFLACTSVAVVLFAIAIFVLRVRAEDPLQLAVAVLANAVCFTGLMLLVSTLGKTESAVAGAGWGILMPLAMLGGAMVPLFVMPLWMQNVGSVSPIKWGILALEGAIWRGFSLAEMLLPCTILVAVGVGCYSLGVWNLARQDA
jgi:ABC-2 type transport system permease protein